MNGTKTRIDQLVAHVCNHEPYWMETFKGALVARHNAANQTDYGSFDDAIADPKAYDALHRDVLNALHRT